MTKRRVGIKKALSRSVSTKTLKCMPRACVISVITSTGETSCAPSVFMQASDLFTPKACVIGAT